MSALTRKGPAATFKLPASARAEDAVGITRTATMNEARNARMRLSSAGQSIEAATISDRNQRFQIKHSLDAVHRSSPRVRQSDAPANQFPFRLGAPAKSSAFHLT